VPEVGRRDQDLLEIVLLGLDATGLLEDVLDGGHHLPFKQLASRGARMSSTFCGWLSTVLMLSMRPLAMSTTPAAMALGTVDRALLTMESALISISPETCGL
jgi:hypothetical protein